MNSALDKLAAAVYYEPKQTVDGLNRFVCFNGMLTGLERRFLAREYGVRKLQYHKPHPTASGVYVYRLIK